MYSRKVNSNSYYYFVYSYNYFSRSYNAAEGKFLIVWVESGKKKPVSRLNLLFDDEDKTNFQNRIEAAFQFRFYCETLLKRATRLEKKDLEKVPSLPSGIQKEIDI